MLLIVTMSKRKQRNGFFLFMQEMQRELINSGRRVSMAEMPLLASPRWNVSSRSRGLYVCRVIYSQLLSVGQVPV